MKRFDRYGLGLHLLFSGKDNFKTGLGGAVSLLLYLITIAYGGGKIYQLVARGDPKLTTTQKQIELNAT
jgi:hypothetical protein